MNRVNLISQLEEQLELKEIELETKILDLKTEYDTQKYINHLLIFANKDISVLAEYLTVANSKDKDICINIMKNFIKDETEIDQIFKEAKNLYNMKKRKFDIMGVPQYTTSKQVLERLVKRINQYNLTRVFKYTNISQINELKKYLSRVKQSRSYFNDGKLVREISDINEIKYIIEKSDIDEIEKTAILLILLEENNKFFQEEGEQDAIETI